MIETFCDFNELGDTLKYWLHILQIDAGFRVDLISNNKMQEYINSDRSFKVTSHAIYKLVFDASVMKFTSDIVPEATIDYAEYLMVGILLEKKGVIEDFSKRLDSDDQFVKITLALRYPNMNPEG